ncbi:flagellar assembly protein FliX [Brevundimonas sp.]|uniref:flagellar assembly protein FliX n=1 Tax=Brevundimonas sp. TaxID=1871086 RepID=UPI001DB2C20E|nr:flagellar assembly protein FliX [Brevundimonas sp.]MBL0947118.1 flagellar assembly protein FliX [Brevundimonas sp.]
MKIQGPQSSGPAARPTRPGQAAGGFSLGGAASASAAGAKSGVAGLSGPTGVASLMALQGVEGVEGAVERRRRAIRRGHRQLDRLEALKLAHLAGQADADALGALSRTGAEDRPDSEDPGLNAVLDQVDLRVAVELAKAAAARS